MYACSQHNEYVPDGVGARYGAVRLEEDYANYVEDPSDAQFCQPGEFMLKIDRPVQNSQQQKTV